MLNNFFTFEMSLGNLYFIYNIYILYYIYIFPKTHKYLLLCNLKVEEAANPSFLYGIEM